MRLLHIIGSMDPATGGPCQGIRNSNAEMEGMGVYREIVSLDAPTAPFLGSDDFPIHALGPARGPWRYSAKLIPWLTENLGRFDVVIVNGIWIFSSYAGWKALRVINNKTQHDIFSPNKTPKLFIMPHGMLDPYFQRAAERKLKAVRNWFYWKIIESRIVNDAYGVLFTCQTELLLARETFSPYHPKREINVGYGIIPPPEFSSSHHKAFIDTCPEINQQPYLLFLSRIHEKKGLDLLIKAYALLFEEAQLRGEKLPKLVVAGPGLKTAFGNKLIQMASASTALKSAILFPGMLSGDAKWGALYSCDAFVLPSHQENFGIAVVEAMACKRAVLISDQVNICIEIKLGGGGIIEKNSIDGVKAMLQQWLSMTLQQRSQMGENAYKVFQENFHIKKTSRAFLNALAS